MANCDSNEINDCSSETYTPRLEDDKLECDIEVYKVLSYLDLEWPSQTIAVHDNSLFVATNPSEDFLKSAELIKITITDDIDKIEKCDSFKFKTVKTNSVLFNKIKVSDEMLYCTSDNLFCIYDLSLKLIRAVKGNFGYGFDINDNYIFIGTTEGRVDIYSKIGFKFLSSTSLHSSVVNDIVFHNDYLYTISDDCRLVISEISGTVVAEYKHESEINTLDVKNNVVVLGCADGLLLIYDIEKKTVEKIKKHLSPVDVVRFIKQDMFVSGSVEQLCIWDLSIEEEIDQIGKYLLFIHQGQKNYKDVVLFNDEMLVSTSIDGLCFFSPISIIDEDISMK